MDELLNETAITMTDLAGERDVNVCTVWRWAKRGVRGVRLETFAVGGRRYTTREAFSRFVTATSAMVVGKPARTPRSRRAAVQRAESELTRAGI